MTTLARPLDYIDLNFLGRTEIIATAVLKGPSGAALVDPGPSSTLDTLRASLERMGTSIQDVRQLLLTHIHLDHAGATGTLVKENPRIEVFVHERGAPHMTDPAKLLASASRLYGQDMDVLWGEFLPVPADRVRALKGGERISAGGRELEVAYTPGHASHHVSYFDRAAATAFVGDVAGIRRGKSGYILPPTPPPDIDLELWRASEERVLSWEPETLFLTHFGAYQGARPHFEELNDRLSDWSRIARRLIADASLTDDQRQEIFVTEALDHMRQAVGDEEAEQYGRAGRLDYSWQGLARYWRKREAR